MKSTFFIILILLSFCSKGQNVYPWYYNITNKIDRIQKEEFDSVFSYINIYGSTSWSNEVKGLGNINIQGEAILLGFKNDKISCIKIIQSLDSAFKSKSIEINLDSALQILRLKLAEINSEIILPYVCEIYADSTSNIKGFYPLERQLHTSFCSIYFKCSTNSYIKEFDLESLNDKSEKPNINLPNLNFKYNSSLTSYKLYFFLASLLSMYGNQFDFGK